MKQMDKIIALIGEKVAVKAANAANAVSLALLLSAQDTKCLKRKTGQKKLSNVV